MIVKAQARHVRQSPFKVRRVLDLIRGLPVEEARTTLQFTNRRAAEVVAKVLDSAVANAEHNNALDVDLLYVVEAYAGEGPTLKRFRPRARGRAGRIDKRTSHIVVGVAEHAFPARCKIHVIGSQVPVPDPGIRAPNSKVKPFELCMYQ